MNLSVPAALKDPAVIAAVITAFVAVIAAAVAFAAGRMQGRGAHWGPVDAVRRQHQREAYAAFLGDLWTYLGATNWDSVKHRTTHDMLLAGLAVDEASVTMSTFAHLATLPPNVQASGSVVFLEGPDLVAESGLAAQDAANAVWRAAMNGVMNPSAGSEMVNAYRAAHHVLHVRTNAFALDARWRLNSKM
ncbi:hypothetical protein ACFVFT_38600 [Streptomyces tendae]|uniref:hypothetical protein n=1 Tax=Streptomyces tendae TaxID=1932 RepID=UPI00369E8D6B